jgi:hypothetical protein
MKPIASVTLCAGLLAFQLVQGEESNKVDKMRLPNIVEMTDSTVLKVFSAEGGGAKYKAYLVKWKNQEVVVTDMYGGPELKEGDTVKVMVQVVDIPTAGIKVLQFVSFDASAMMSRIMSTRGSNNVKKNVGTSAGER